MKSRPVLRTTSPEDVALRVLIDTQALIWFAMDDPRLSLRARAAISEPGNHYSIATIWEAALKSGLGKLDLMRGTTRISAKEYFQRVAAALELTLLPITLSAAAGVEFLPRHHQDPFDRLLISQAIQSKLAVVSSDVIFDRYEVTRIW